MIYGFCTGFATEPLFRYDVPLMRSVLEAGYDYAELPLMCLQNLEESEIDSLSSWFSAPVMCNLFPGSVPLYDDRKAIADYLSLMLPRASKLGVREVVFGSGKARTYPENL